MKKTFLLFILALCSIALFAQNEDWHWAKKAGGTGGDYCRSIAVDDNGNSYVTGVFEGSATFGTTTLTSSGQYDIFVAKMDINGNWLWAKKAGGTSYDYGLGITVDANGNSYVTGYFLESATFGATTLTSSGNEDIFIAKLDINGNWLWAKKAGGTSYDYGCCIAVDDNGNSYITGFFCSSSCSFGNTTLTSSGSDDIFVAKLDSNGNWLWAKKAGGQSNDGGRSITVDDNGNSYVTGDFSGSATFGTTTLTSSGYYDYDIFVAKLDINGNWLWAKKAGGQSNDGGRSITVDDNGNSYITGCFWGSATFGATTLTSSGDLDIFVAKLDINGNWLWAKQAGGTDFDYGYGIAVDDNGNSYVTGYFRSSATFGTTTLTSSGYEDIFVAKLDSSGNWLWAKKAGGTSYDKGYSIAVDVNGNSYVIGYFSGSATFGTTTLTSSGDTDIFISKIGIPVYQVLAPNGGEQWQTGSTKTVYWNFNIGNYVNIQLSLDNGVNWIMLNSSPIGALLGRFSFTVPYVSSNNCLIKVVSTENSDYFDISDATFTIINSVPYSLLLTAPNYSKLQAGKNYSINWTAAGITRVNLAYSCDAGVTWNSIVTALPANQETYEWTVPDISASNCYLKVSDSAQPAIYDWSDQPFSICNLNLLSPNGGEVYAINTNLYISWNSELIETVKIEFSSDNGNSWLTIANNVSAAAGSYSWTTPDINSSQCLIKISDATDNTFWDISDNPFTIRPQIIVIAPNGNEYIAVYSIYSILWSNTEEVSFVLIDYSIDGGVNWLPVQTSPYPASTGRYDWLVPNNPSTNCLIKVRNSANSAIFDVSDGVFTITTGLYPPTVNFTADVTSGLQPLEVHFTDQSTAGTGSIIFWNWEFGNGDNSNEQHPVYVYQDPGVYSVTLTVTNSVDSTATLTRDNYITVIQRVPEIEVNPPTMLNFGSVYLGSSSTLYSVVISNTGTAELLIDNLSLAESNSFFSFVNTVLQLTIPAGEETEIALLFTPQEAGTVSDTLYIHNNSVNSPLYTLELRGTGEYVPPKPPNNLVCVMDGYNAVLTWDAVTETIFDTPIVPDYYLVFYNGSANPEGEFYFHGATPDLTYTHSLVGLHSPYMFYRIVAYKFYGREKVSIEDLGLTRGMTETEVRNILQAVETRIK
ncbi:MAG TPA: SBBP repeat-containing protein [Candidatus Cloacimonas acidaminovorans]|nr:SBBP repeat-containing protein [Candidatus Cloacimonas acidaminovorans]